ncbi:MAG: protein kinase [Nitratireductor sp.]
MVKATKVVTRRAPLRANTMISGYRIEKSVGEGGFGIVYKAFHPILKVRVAIKEYFPSNMDTGRDGTKQVIVDNSRRPTYDRFLEKFRETTGLLHTLNHPNIVKVLGYEEKNNTGYMVMDYVEGQTLKQWLDEKGDITALQIRQFMKPVFSALDYLHSRKMYHRDISPMNIMIKTDDTPIIIDFGALKQDLESEGKKLGMSTQTQVNLDYAPFEQTAQSENHPVGPHTDVYATAATLYQLIAKELPVASERRTGCLARGEPDPYVPLAKNAKIEMKAAEFAAIDKAMSYFPADRFATMKDFAIGLGWNARGLKGEKPPVVPIPSEIPGKDSPQQPLPPKKNWMAPAGIFAIVAAVFAFLAFYSLNTSQGEADTCAKQEDYAAAIADKSPAKLRNYINNCEPKRGNFVDQAKRQLDDWTKEDEKWAALDRSSLEALRGYVGEFRDGLHEDEAQAIITKLEADDARWAQVSGARSIKRIQSYLDAFPQGRHASEARDQIAGLRKAEREAFAEVEFSRRISDLEGFRREFPDGELLGRADEQISKLRAEEKEHWEGISDSRSAAVFEAYLARFPDGVHAPEARERIAQIEQSSTERVAWQQAQRADTIAAYQQYLNDYPVGEFSLQAKDRIKVLQDEIELAAWRRAQAADTIDAYRAYLDEYSAGKFASAARERIRQLGDTGELVAWNLARTTNTAAAVEAFLGQFPSGKFSGEARNLLQNLRDDEAWQSARARGTEEAINGYLSQFRNGRHVAEARALLAELASTSAAAMQARLDDEAWSTAQQIGNIQSVSAYLNGRDFTRHRSEAQQMLDRLRNSEFQLAQQASNERSATLAQRYLRDYPVGVGRYRDEMQRLIDVLRTANANCDTPNAPQERLEELARNVLIAYYNALDNADRSTAQFHFPTIGPKTAASISRFAEARITSGISVNVIGSSGRAYASFNSQVRAQGGRAEDYAMRSELQCISSRWQIQNFDGSGKLR